MGRRPSGTFPPYISLKEAIYMVTVIYEKMGGSASRDSLGRLMRNTPKSSSFIKKVGALKSYGLINEEPAGIYNLTPLSKRIVSPQSPSDKATALLSALQNINLFSALYTRFKGKLLPEEQFLANLIEHEFKVPSPVKLLWTKGFLESGDIAGIFSREGIKTVVKESVTNVEWTSAPKSYEEEEKPMDVPKEIVEPGWEKAEITGVKISIQKPIDENKIEAAKTLLDLISKFGKLPL